MNPITRTRKSAFSYQCHACNKCCYNKLIQINPYEALRLSNYLGITTTNFRQNYLAGQFLKQKEDTCACQFLGESGCMVHKNRPLVCRLYPLGRLRLNSGDEVFTELFAHPESKGMYGNASNIEDYLEAQQVSPFLNAETSYLKLIQQMAALALNEIDVKKNGKKQPNKSTAKTIDYADWILDPDPIIERYCTWKNLEIPSDVEQKFEFHIAAIQSWVDGTWNLSSVN